MADLAAPSNPNADLNQVLSEVIDVVQAVKQAHRKVPETHALHALLDNLFAELGRWARLLMDRDKALGVSALESMPSVAGRKPANLWPGAATDEEVRRVITEHLDGLAQHVAVARAEQDDDASKVALATVERELLAQRHAFSAP